MAHGIQIHYSTGISIYLLLFNLLIFYYSIIFIGSFVKFFSYITSVSNMISSNTTFTLILHRFANCV